MYYLTNLLLTSVSSTIDNNLDYIIKFETIVKISRCLEKKHIEQISSA